MKPGSVVVDLAAESGGNIETTKPGEVYSYKDVVHVGLTDLPSRLPTQSSTLYANNISKFLLSIGVYFQLQFLWAGDKNKLFPGEKGFFNIDLEDEVVRGSIILRDGTVMWPPPPPPPPTPQQIAAAAAPKAVVAAPEPPNPFNITLKNSMVYTTGKRNKLDYCYN